jgi:hypothetical protein
MTNPEEILCEYFIEVPLEVGSFLYSSSISSMGMLTYLRGTKISDGSLFMLV